MPTAAEQLIEHRSSAASTAQRAPDEGTLASEAARYDVLGRCSPADVASDPFEFVAVQEAVPAALYRELDRTFPTLQQITGGRSDYGSNQAVRMTLQKGLQAGWVEPCWRAFFEFHTSQAFWREIVRVFGEALRQRHPDLEERVGRPFEEWRVKSRSSDGEAEANLDLLFVANTPVLTPSSVKPAHIDRADKIFSGLFYCRDAQDHAEGGDLELFALSKRPLFDKHEVPASRVQKVAAIPYRANTFVGFVNSVASVHAVSPRHPTPVPRRYINFIVEVPFQAFKVPQMNRVHRAWYHAVHRPPRRVYSRDE